MLSINKLSKSLVALFALLGVATAALAAEPKSVVNINTVRLYVPDATLRDRIGNSVDPVTNYIKALHQEAINFWQSKKAPGAKGILIAVGVKPGKKVHIWCDAVDGQIPADTLRAFEQKLDTVNAPDVHKAPIAFGMELNLFGNHPAQFPSFPQAWITASKKSPTPVTVPDGLFKIVWPD